MSHTKKLEALIEALRALIKTVHFPPQIEPDELPRCIIELNHPNYRALYGRYHSPLNEETRQQIIDSTLIDNARDMLEVVDFVDELIGGKS